MVSELFVEMKKLLSLASFTEKKMLLPRLMCKMTIQPDVCSV